MVSQISVFMENRKGRILKFTEVLRDNGIDLLSLSVADTKDFGILRCVVRDNEKAVAVLRDAGFTVASTELIGVEVEDRPGGLCEILTLFEAADINMEYVYSFVRRANRNAVIFLKVSDDKRAVDLLEKKGIKLLNQKALCAD